MIRPAHGAVVDGIRQTATVEALRRAVRPLKVAIVYVHAPTNVAFAFYSHRSKDATMAAFLRAIGAPVEQDVQQFLGAADAVVYNWMGRAALAAALDPLIRGRES